MQRVEVAIQKRPTVETLLAASRVGRSFYFADTSTGEQTRILERVRNIPFSPMWRKVIEEADPLVKTDFAREVIKAAKNCNDKNFLKRVASQLAGHFPAEVLRAEIDPELEPKKPAQYEDKKSLAVFLREARGNYARTLRKRRESREEADTERSISDSWIKLTVKLAGRDKERHERVYKEARNAYETQFVAAGAIVGVEPGYENLSPSTEALLSLAPVLARNFPRTVISHLRTPQKAPVGANA